MSPSSINFFHSIDLIHIVAPALVVLVIFLVFVLLLIKVSGAARLATHQVPDIVLEGVMATVLRLL